MSNRGCKPASPHSITTKYRGGPLDGEESVEYHSGLTIREHFAAMAMQGMLSTDGRNGETWQRDLCAKAAVAMADALLTELSIQAQP